MFETFDFDVIRRSLPYLFIDGMTFTLTLTALAAAGGLLFGTLIALLRLSRLPVLLTQTIVLFQDTSLVYVLSIPDFLGAASKVAQRDGRLVEMYLFAAVVYFTISFVASVGVRRLQSSIRIAH